MNKIDLIIDALEDAVHNVAGDDTEEKCIKALAAARELKTLKPVLWKATGDAWFYEKPLFQATPLYALEDTI
jgi:hypothetical protein